MSAQLLKEQKENTFPPLDNTRWNMLEVNANGIVQTGVIWHFTTEYAVHDEPELWDGHWSKTDDFRVIINRTDTVPPYKKYRYDVLSAGPNVLVIVGSDDTSSERILLGSRL